MAGAVKARLGYKVVWRRYVQLAFHAASLTVNDRWKAGHGLRSHSQSRSSVQVPRVCAKSNRFYAGTRSGYGIGLQGLRTNSETCYSPISRHLFF